MAMKRKHRRLILLLLSLGMLGSATILVLNAFEDSLVFFYSPTDLAEKQIGPDQRIRLGGLVEEGSIQRDGATLHFRVTDLNRAVPVRYVGIVPDLFREGQGVVTEGQFDVDGTFTAVEVLAKHDETYMPKEVANALREAGQWKGGENQ
jgi:cytochrome c-type biogenesis protein CcmE